MTSEFVQRLAEWLEGRAYGRGEYVIGEEFAQEALDASGATARIEELEGEVVYGCEVPGHPNRHTHRHPPGSVENAVLLSNALLRADQAEKRVEELEKALDRAEDEGCICGRLMNKEPHRPGCAFWLTNELRAALSPAQQSEPS